MNIIEFHKVTYSYKAEEAEIAVVRDFNLGIEKGSFTAILGQNGSGKSTLAKLMNGLYKPTGGDVLVDGMNTKDEKTEIEIKRRVGLVFQNPDNQLIASVVEEDVAFGPENLGLAPAEIRKRVDAALEAVDMAAFGKSAPHHLSGGQKQRVAIAGILAMEPECLVLDEPTAMLDPKGRAEVVDILTRLNREKGITVVLITHYMEEAQNADRVLVLNQGAILFDAAPKAAFSQVEKMKKAGLSVPQTTELLYRLRQAGIPVETDAISVEETAEKIAACVFSEEA